MAQKEKREVNMNRIIILSLFCFIPYFTFAQTPTHNPIDPHWQLKWQDEFNTFNDNIWLKANNAIHKSDTKEPQLYLANQVSTSNGYLVIELNNTPATCPNPAPPTWPCVSCISGKTYNYRSGLVQTREAYNTQYGYIEARIKFPYRAGKKWGFWPAFWTMCNVSSCTNAGEIDICEIFARNKPPNHFGMAVIRQYKNEDHPKDADGFPYQSSNFSYNEWHTYAIEWNSSRMIWYLDGKAVASLSNHRIVDPIRIILNLAVLENSGSDAQYQPPTSPYFHDEMYVDYVKVYKLRCDSNTPLVINNLTDLSNYDNKVKKSITINSITIPSGNDIYLRANDFIELKPGFEVQTGRGLYLDVSPCEAINIKGYEGEGEGEEE
jgi:beta-glucanase (GH16 family)